MSSLSATAGPAPAQAVSRRALVRGSLVCLLLVILGVNARGIVADFAAAIRSPLELDYGEGIVWQQAALIPGPAMYAGDQSLPFIVFHYPPVYYLLTHAMAWVAPDLLAAGRLVSVVSTAFLMPLIAALVLLATPRDRNRGLAYVAAVAACLLVLALTPVRVWGMLMRVDMPGLVFGFAGLAVAARADGRFAGTVLALLLCLLAVFTKQTLLCFGVAVFVLAVLQRPKAAVAAAGLVGCAGVGVTLLLQAQTSGGFLRHIVGYNINRFSLEHALEILGLVWNNLAVMALAILAGGWLLPMCIPRGARSVRGAIERLRLGDVVVRRRLLVLVHFALSCAMLVTLCKVGSFINYLLEWCCSGGVILGVAFAELIGRSAISDRVRWPVLLSGGLLAGSFILSMPSPPNRYLPSQAPAAETTLARDLVQRIAAAPLPVGSENMVLLMQAGRRVVYEPAIATELAHVGLWNETPLVDAIRHQGFAFMLTSDGGSNATDRRTQAVNDAMVQAYPKLRQLQPGLWIREP